MKHRPRPEEQDDLLRPRLIDMIDPRHELVKLAALIDWEVFERKQPVGTALARLAGIWGD
jgi:IS5 family transposase